MLSLRDQIFTGLAGPSWALLLFDPAHRLCPPSAQLTSYFLREFCLHRRTEGTLTVFIVVAIFTCAVVLLFEVTIEVPPNGVSTQSVC